MKKFIKLDIKPIQFGYVVRVLEQSHFEYEFGINGDAYFRPPGYRVRDGNLSLILRSAGWPGADAFSFWVRGASSMDNPVVILHKNSNASHYVKGYGVGGGKRWCKQYVSKLEKVVRLYNNYDW